jgi:hypothetical protein
MSQGSDNLDPQRLVGGRDCRILVVLIETLKKELELENVTAHLKDAWDVKAPSVYLKRGRLAFRIPQRKKTHIV